MNVRPMKFFLVLILLLVLAWFGYATYYNSNGNPVSSEREMTQNICEAIGGDWLEERTYMNAKREEETSASCACKKFALGVVSYVNEGERRTCP